MPTPLAGESEKLHALRKAWEAMWSAEYAYALEKPLLPEHKVEMDDNEEAVREALEEFMHECDATAWRELDSRAAEGEGK